MESRRDRLLQQLGITQWTLRRPTVLQGEIAVSLPAQVRLVIVSAEPLADDEPLLADVLHSLALTPSQAYRLTPQQIEMLPADVRCHSWRLGIEEPIALQGVQLSSPLLSELYQNADAKQALWQQICEHEHDIFSDAS
ncbi:DNA polymerase III subunit psi [Pectobacterium aroidearum]|uniref:DNA polymerase III subunit psi n=1 Tax=Pectobacterium aroidearum TaxID=1201031 RepID=A0ABR5ZEB1_9GAMM|nr:MULTISPECIES: DNA polymerase III subunit psi [Pectobacterium]MBA5200084.1 DNA polymerase III subunit psi [Pectobacterium aroidearum]MBA5228555.1 DNA polymerase III subunit psi [Pectobacterium aroidearum]MBA5232916.1 DNA polymerase III subunit psi [Pectobacterium aroidearum]MBA5738078.1 DNA polymerase III subunit psi [Pectobacterium aroidearum]UUE44364.1 DNA polymerase III subunit psi [Pectobacterium aroidearum]